MRYLFLTLAFVLVTGCSSSRNMTEGLRVQKEERAVFVSDHFTGYTERHIGEVVRVLENNGFTITNKKEGSKYSLYFDIEGGATLTVYLGLVAEGKKVVEVEATNVWFGTVMFRPVAVANRVEAALGEFREALSTL